MKRIFILFIALFSFSFVQAQIPWKNGKKAAVVLTYDDGLTSQLQYAIPELDSVGFRGTFYLFGAGLKAEETEAWRRAAAEGHELGNHTIYHPCGRSDADSTDCHALDCYTVKDILNEIAQMNKWLVAIDGRSEHSFAFPCCLTKAGGEDYSKPIVEKGLAKYSRGGGERIITSVDSLDFANVPTIAAMNDHANADWIITQIERTVKAHGAIVIIFHGVGGDYLTFSAADHRKLLSYLKAHENEIWTAPFSQVMTYLSGLRQH